MGEHLPLSGVSSESGSRAAAVEELADERRLDDGAAAGDDLEGGDEVVHVGDTIFEQVADPLGGSSDELEGVVDFDVLGEHDGCDSGEVAPYLLGGEQAFVGEGGRHADVDHGDVGTVNGYVLEQFVGVARLGGNVDSAVGEEAGETFTHDHGVVGNDHPHGIAAVTRVP